MNLWFKAFQFSIKLINTAIILLRLSLFPSHINLAELHGKKCSFMTFRSYTSTAAGINSNLNFWKFCFKNECIAYNADSSARLERRNFNVPGKEFFLNNVNRIAFNEDVSNEGISISIPALRMIISYLIKVSSSFVFSSLLNNDFIFYHHG